MLALAKKGLIDHVKRRNSFSAIPRIIVCTSFTYTPFIIFIKQLVKMHCIMSTANIWYVVRERVIFEKLLMNMMKDMNSDQQHMVTVVEQYYI